MKTSPGLWRLVVVLLLPAVSVMMAHPRAGAQQATEVIKLTDVTASAGIGFMHRHGGSGRHYYVETMSGGGTFFDYDDDGDLDIFLAQGAPLPGFTAAGPLLPALYRNNGNGTFTDVTAGSGFDTQHYGMGVAAADYDNDGRQDLFVSAFGGNRLFHNEGNGRFRDVGARAGVQGRDLSTSAAWVDYDQDGWLDLFVARYMDYDLENNPRCKDELGRSAYCSPHVYKGTNSLLYRNNRNGTFIDVSIKSGIGREVGRSLGVAIADFDKDGRIDLFVANDLSPNFLFFNNGDGTFREDGLFAGVSHGDSGVAYAGMGTDAADYDNDGDIDLIVTNFEDEPISVFRNNGDGTFTNATYPSGIGTPSRPYLGWGAQFVDFDLDARVDLFVVNGHVDDYADTRPRSLGYAQRALLFHNVGGGRFADISSRVATVASRKDVGRGAAFGDYDNDGDVDILVTSNNGPARLMRNDTVTVNNAVRLKLVGKSCNRDGLGTRMSVNAGGIVQTRYHRSGTSYLADHDRRPVFGIGQATEADLELQWPCGSTQRLRVAKGRLSTVHEEACRLRKHTLTRSQR